MDFSQDARVHGPGDSPDLTASDRLAVGVTARLAPFEFSAHGVLLTRPDGRIEDANPAACRFLGRDSAELRSLGNAGVADPTDERWHDVALTRAAQGCFRGRLRMVRGDGSVFTADVSSPVFLDAGEPWIYVLFDDASDVDAAMDAAARQQAYADVVVEMLDSISDAYYSVDADWNVTFFNRQAERLLKASRADVLGKNLWDMFPAARDTVFQHQYEHAVRTQESVSFEGYYLGTDLRCEVRAYPISGGGLAVYFLDVGDRYAVARERERLLRAERRAREEAEIARATAERARAELADRAAADDLTGLLNRAGLADAMQQALRVRGVTVCLLLADLDNLKLVNDTLGHDVGDRVLQLFADHLRALAGPTALLARLGSDEFAVALVDHSTEQADALAEQILAMARRPVEADGHSLLLTASIGLARMSEGDTDLGRLLRHADAARYRAKRDGRDQAAWFDDRLHDQAVERVVLERELRAAIETDALTVHFQPEFDLRTGRVVDVEALARWHSPTRGPISPAVFVPIAEESGLIRALGDQILGTSIAQAVRWGAQENVRVWVNVSPRQLATMGLADRIESLLQRVGLPAERLGIEVTESSLIDERRFADELHAIHELGVGLAIDDFGTGYSSFARLARMPVDLVKIDRSFISSADTPRGRSLLQGMVSLGHSLGARVTAEGVETTEQLHYVIDAGFDSAAGYLLQRPAAPEDVVWSAMLS